MSAPEVYSKMKFYRRMSRTERRRFICNAQFPFADVLCKSCFISVYGIARNTFYRNRRETSLSGRSLLGIGNPCLHFEHGNSGGSKRSPAFLRSVAFLEAYASQYGDFMPDANEIHLPDYSWKMVREKMIFRSPQNRCSKATFSRACKEVPHVKVRKSKRFSECQWCWRLKKKCNETSGERKKFWEAEHTQHNEWQMRERLAQAKHVELATNDQTREEHMVLMIDNMDHSKSSLPNFPRTPKDVDGSELLNTHITGIHVPGWKQRPYTCYTWHDRFPTGSDSVITMVLKTLCDYAKDRDGKLPPNLYLHMDNCWRENKNRFVLALAHLLVHAGCFKRVDICFLPVGHTHNIVDQMFSRFSTAMATKDIFTVDDIHRICREGYTTAACFCNNRFKIRKNKLHEDAEKCTCPEVPVYFEHLDEMACWGPIMEKCMVSKTKINGISKPRYFRVQRDANGVVRHQYRSQLQTPKDCQQQELNANSGCSSNAVGFSVACLKYVNNH